MKVIYSKSFIDFLKKSDCIIASLLYKLHCKNYDSLLLSTSEINYLTFRNDGTISYLPEGKELKYNDSGEWARDGRQNGKAAKVIRKLLSGRALKWFKDSDFECFTNSYKANFSADGYKFELLDNTSIPAIYDEDVAEGDGSINGSCMKGESGYMDIYRNCDKLKILILRNKDGELCGRALIWYISEGITLMDRIYTTQDFMFDNFLNYAKTNKFWYKENYKTYQNKTSFINLEGDAVCRNFTISTDTDFDYYPYIDTFSYGDDGTLSNSGGIYTYNNTDGTRDGGEDDHNGQVFDEINDCYIDEDDAVYIDAGQRCYRDRYCHIDNCVSVNDEWYYEDDNSIVQVNGEYYTTDSDEICEIDGDYHKMDDCVYSEKDSCYYLCEDCVYSEEDGDILESESVEIDGDYYHEDNESIIKIDGDYYLKSSDDVCKIEDEYYLIDSDEVCEIDGDYYLTDSPEIVEIDGEYQLKQLTISFND